MASKFFSTDVTIRDFEKKIKKIHSEDSFQRPKGCWTKSQRIAFIQSVFDGYNSSPIVVANIAQCIDYSETFTDIKSAAYYKALSNNGKRYLSLDGQHRTLTIMDFLDDKWSFSGTIELDNGETQTVVNKKWSEMDTDVQNTFYMKNVLFQQFSSATRSQLAPIFIAINSGSPLTPQHMRNALDTPLAFVIRDFAKRFRTVLDTYYSSEQKAKMKPEEDFSKMLMHYSNPKLEVFKKGLDGFYAEGISEGAEGPYSKVYSESARETLESVLQYLEQICYFVNKTNGISRPKFLLMVLALESVVTSGCKILDVKKFVTSVSNLNDNLSSKSDIQRGLDEQNGKTIEELDYYSHCAKQNWHSSARNNRQKWLWQAMSSDLNKFSLELRSEENAAK